MVGGWAGTAGALCPEAVVKRFDIVPGRFPGLPPSLAPEG